MPYPAEAAPARRDEAADGIERACPIATPTRSCAGRLRETGIPPVRRWLMRSGVRYGALWAGRRDGGWRDTSLVAALAAPVVLPPTLLAAAAWLVYAVVEALAGLAGKGVNP